MEGEAVVYETEAGVILLVGEKIIHAISTRDGGLGRTEAMRAIGEKAAESGISRVRVAGNATDSSLGGHLEIRGMDDRELGDLRARKVKLMVDSGLVRSEQEAIALVRDASIKAAEEVIRAESSRPDLHLVQAIQGLDDLDKFLNNTMVRVSEWYGLHFPELVQLVQDNEVLCKLVAENGRRERFTREALEGKGFSQKKVEAILTAAEKSKGGEASERDMERIASLARLGLQLNGERERLNNYVESGMRKIAPNLAIVAGPTIGARLMARANGLDRLAILPASTIQVLGAEKALFRALKTGARPPKHGIIFQHQEVHTAPKWQRGKIARTIANKIAIAARIDYYRGSEEVALKGQLEERLSQIKTKYREPSPQSRRPKKKRGR